MQQITIDYKSTKAKLDKINSEFEEFEEGFNDMEENMNALNADADEEDGPVIDKKNARMAEEIKQLVNDNRALKKLLEEKELEFKNSI
jgi:hypothetical protein